MIHGQEQSRSRILSRPDHQGATDGVVSVAALSNWCCYIPTSRRNRPYSLASDRLAGGDMHYHDIPRGMDLRKYCTRFAIINLPCRCLHGHFTSTKGTSSSSVLYPKVLVSCVCLTDYCARSEKSTRIRVLRLYTRASGSGAVTRNRSDNFNKLSLSRNQLLSHSYSRRYPNIWCFVTQSVFCVPDFRSYRPRPWINCL